MPVHLIVYSIVLVLVLLLLLPYFFVKGIRTGKYFASFGERIGCLPRGLNPERRRSLWIHAVSVGEVLAVRPLLALLRERFPDRRLILSTTTLTGQALARKSAASDVDAIFFAPFDWPICVRRALTVVNPELLVLVETELWPHLIHQARRSGVRIAVVNGRISPRSFPRYRLIRGLFRRVLREVDLFLMQSEPNAGRAIEIGAPAECVRVPGNVKYDGLGDGTPSAEMSRLIGRRQPLLVAGSTVSGEESAVLAAFRLVRASFPKARLLLAPRHPERFDEVFALLESSEFESARRTRLSPEGWTRGDILLLDTIGELLAAYPLADIVFVGGSLVERGGHNILEPAVAGKAVVVGPHMQNFQEMVDEFLGEGALVQVASGEDLARVIIELLVDNERRLAIGERAQRIIERNRGTSRRTLEALAELLES